MLLVGIPGYPTLHPSVIGYQHPVDTVRGAFSLKPSEIIGIESQNAMLRNDEIIIWRFTWTHSKVRIAKVVNKGNADLPPSNFREVKFASIALSIFTSKPFDHVPFFR